MADDHNTAGELGDNPTDADDVGQADEVADFGVDIELDTSGFEPGLELDLSGFEPDPEPPPPQPAHPGPPGAHGIPPHGGPPGPHGMPPHGGPGPHGMPQGGPPAPGGPRPPGPPGQPPLRPPGPQSFGGGSAPNPVPVKLIAMGGGLLVLVLLIAALFSGGSDAPEGAQGPEQTLEEGERAYHQGKWVEALTAFQRLRRYPTSKEAQSVRERGLEAKAIEAIMEAEPSETTVRRLEGLAQLFPDRPQVRERLGEVRKALSSGARSAPVATDEVVDDRVMDAGGAAD